jgi:hypothetical protein
MGGMRIGRTGPARSVRELVTAAVPGLAERMLITLIRGGWAAAVGSELARRTDPLALEHGTLSVGAETSASLQELALRAPDIVEALARRFGSAVSSVRPTLYRRRPASAPATEQRPRDIALTPAETASVENLASAIADPVVAAAVRRVLVKDHLARRPQLAHPHYTEPLRSPVRTA